jgi:hypothetical protein
LTHFEQRDTGIGRFGHFAGLTASAAIGTIHPMPRGNKNRRTVTCLLIGILLGGCLGFFFGAAIQAPKA